MKSTNVILSVLMIMISNTGLIAQGPLHDCDEAVIESIVYIEEENEFDLGFDTDDYLPKDFDPYKLYVNLDRIEFIEDEEWVVDSQEYLPKNFNPYAYPSNFRHINYIDPADEVQLDFETEEYLPEGFDPYQRTGGSEAISL